MYTGTLIHELMATVERAERGAFRTRIVDEMELLRMYELPVSPMDSEPAYAGAA